MEVVNRAGHVMYSDGKSNRVRRWDYPPMTDAELYQLAQNMVEYVHVVADAILHWAEGPIGNFISMVVDETITHRCVELQSCIDQWKQSLRVTHEHGVVQLSHKYRKGVSMPNPACKYWDDLRPGTIADHSPITYTTEYGVYKSASVGVSRGPRPILNPIKRLVASSPIAKPAQIGITDLQMHALKAYTKKQGLDLFMWPIED